MYRYAPLPTNAKDANLTDAATGARNTTERCSESVPALSIRSGFPMDHRKSFMSTAVQWAQTQRFDFKPILVPNKDDEVRWSRQNFLRQMTAVLGNIVSVVSTFRYMASKHLVHLMLLFSSFALCVMCGAVHVQMVDSSFFKAIGLLLAVLLSLRAKNAVSRRYKLMHCVLTMLNNAKNLIFIAGVGSGDKRRRLRDMLFFCFVDIATWVSGEKPEDSPGLDVLPPEDRDLAFLLRCKLEASSSPRFLLLYLREFCDELFDPETAESRAPLSAKNFCRQSCTGEEANALSAYKRLPHASHEGVDKVSLIRRWHRNVDVELSSLAAQFDFLLMYKEEFLTIQFRWMLETVIFIYIAMYPWCVQNESTLTLALTNLGMACVFFGLNSLTEQIEDPVVQKGQGFDLNASFVQFFEALDSEEEIRNKCQRFMETHKLAGQEVSEALHESFLRTLSPPRHREDD